MITDLVDLESLLGQYDAGVIFVGPLLSLSLSSSFRYFYIAGKGSKVYQTIRLGFVEDETNGQEQHADVVKKLEKRFAQVIVFGSHWEMADAVHTRWPNEETARVLTSAAQTAAKPEPAKAAGRGENVDDNHHAAATPSNYSEHYGDRLPREPGDHEKDISAALMSPPPSARGQGPPIAHLPRAPTLMPSPTMPVAIPNEPLSNGHAVERQQRDFRLGQDDIALAVSRLVKTHAQQGDLPGQRVESPQTVGSIVLRFLAVGGVVAMVAAATVLLATLQVGDETTPATSPPLILINKDTSQAAVTPASSVSSQVAVTNQPSPQAESASAAVPPSPLSQPSEARDEAALVSEPQSPLPPGMRVDTEKSPAPINRGADNLARGDLASARHPTEVAPTTVPAPLNSVDHGENPSQTSAAVAPSGANQETEAKKPARQIESSPPSQSSQAANVRGGAAASSEVPSLPAQDNSSGEHLDAERIVALVNRAEDSLKSGDLAAAQLLLRRAAEAMPHAVVPAPLVPVDRDKDTAAIAPVVAPPAPNQSAPNQLTEANKAVRQLEPVPAPVPPAPPSPPSPLASAQTQTGPTPAPMQPSPSLPLSPLAEAKTGPMPVPGSQPPAARGGSTTVHLDAEEIAALVNRGMDFLKNGDLVSARLLLQRAAEAGDASAALMLGATFDPLVIQQPGAIGVQPDVKKAREWYEKAAALGSELASQQLTKLAKTAQ